MKARTIACAAAWMFVCAWSAVPAHALGVEIWTDRGSDAVYEPGDALVVQARASDDGFLLVYEIDSEGRVNLLYPYQGSDGFVEGDRTYDIPPERANVELVVNDPTGQAYLVAVASRRPFRELPWYLKPYDATATEVGYAGEPDDEEGITAEGRIVGDPFVAMERIRRRVLEDPDDVDGFASAYAAYYVGHEVRYPRYLCYDCHRPGHWAWWSDFDPYYTTCSVFDFRVNRRWYWGPNYWLGSVPYYYYVYRHDCPPRYHRYSTSIWYSSWDGWRRWCGTWGGPLTRYKSAPPPGYRPPGRHDDRGSRPPGFLAGGPIRDRGSMRPTTPGVPFGTRGGETGATRPGGRGTWRAGDGQGGRPTEPGVVREPGTRSPGGRGTSARPQVDRRRDDQPRPTPVHAPFGTVEPRPIRDDDGARPTPRRAEERRRFEPTPTPRRVEERRRSEPAPTPAPRRAEERRRFEPGPTPRPVSESPRYASPRRDPPREARRGEDRPRESRREKPDEARSERPREARESAPPPKERESARERPSPRPEPRHERGVRNGGERGRR
jgi:hypothetical protein